MKQGRNQLCQDELVQARLQKANCKTRCKLVTFCTSRVTANATVTLLSVSDAAMTLCYTTPIEILY